MHLGILKQALKECEKSDMHPFRVGAVIFHGKRIMAYGHNKKQFPGSIHPKYRNEYPSLHAEQDAILKIQDWSKLSGVSMLIVRTNANGNISMAKPCEMCMSMIKHVGIKTIYYTNYESEIQKQKI